MPSIGVSVAHSPQRINDVRLEAWAPCGLARSHFDQPQTLILRDEQPKSRIILNSPCSRQASNSAASHSAFWAAT
jgi:hypothetical protein